MNFLERGHTLAVILGAQDWPLAKLNGGRQFYNSAMEMKVYVESQLGIDHDDVHDLFDSELTASAQLASIGDFLTRRISLHSSLKANISSLLLYYVGHGGFVENSNEFLVLVRQSDPRYETECVLARSIGQRLKLDAPLLRQMIILDCCFSGAVHREWQSLSAAEVAVRSADSELPSRGSAFLCSSAEDFISMAPKGAHCTMFTGSLLSALKAGDPDLKVGISARLARDLSWKAMQRDFGKKAIRPVVFGLDRGYGDLSEVPAFPNTPWRRDASDEAAVKQPPSQVDHTDRRRFIGVGLGVLAAATGIVAYESFGPGAGPVSGWKVQVESPPGSIRGIFFLDERSGYAVSDQGELLATTNGGAIWKLAWTVEHAVQLVPALNGVSFVTQETGFVVSSDGRVLRTKNGGANWIPVYTDPKGRFLRALQFIDERHGWAVGGNGLILSTFDGGDYWTIQWEGPLASPSNRTWIPEDAEMRKKREESSFFQDVHFVDRLNGFAVGAIGIFSTVDGGKNWNSQDTTFSGTTGPSFTSVFFLDAKNGFVIDGFGGIAFSENGGLTWGYVRKPGDPANLRRIRFADSNNGWIVGDEGVILSTRDRGLNWALQSVPTETGDLASIFFLNSQVGWTAGRKILATRTGGMQRLRF
jgi:photosystem II stability/assembly factor-like uncharacterized protein